MGITYLTYKAASVFWWQSQSGLQSVPKALLSFFAGFAIPCMSQHRVAALQSFTRRAGREASPPYAWVAVLRSSSARNHTYREHITFSSPFKGCIRELIPTLLPAVSVCQIVIRQTKKSVPCSGATRY